VLEATIGFPKAKKLKKINKKSLENLPALIKSGTHLTGLPAES